MVHPNLKHSENTTLGIQSITHAENPIKGESGATAKDQAAISKLSIGGFSAFGCEINSNITVKSLDLDVDDLSAFHW